MLAIALARHLAANVVGLTFDEAGAGGNLFIAHMPSKPDRAVMIMPTGGPEQPTKAPTDIATLQVMVRSTRDPRPGHTRATDIFDALAGLTSTVIDPTGDAKTLVHSVTPMQSAPIHLGTDAQDRHRWSLNFRLRVHHPTRHRSPWATAI